MKKAIMSMILAALVICAMAFNVSAQAPNSISYQGRLTNAAGDPITTATSVTFYIYAAASGGAPLFTSTQSVTPDANGVFTVELSPMTSAILDGSKRYLGLKIGADAEMTPRQLLTSAPYSYSSQDAPGMASSYDSGSDALTGTIIVVDSIVINCPSAGVLTINASGYFSLYHTSGGGGHAPRAYISTIRASMHNENFTLLEMPSAMPTGAYNVPFAMTTSMAVGSGVTVVYLNADVYAGGGYQVNASDRIGRSHIVATFVPSSYQTDKSGVSGNSEYISGTPAEN
ncbi:MAG: hypothetical protein AB1746_14280 [Candidatus Zixiibacteriota bacterium]